MPLEPLIAAAVEALYQDYEDLIADPEAQLPKWADYGEYGACRLCNAVVELPGADKKPYHKHSCKAHCPLGPTTIREMNMCRKEPSCVMRKSWFDEMLEALENKDPDAIREVAPKRLAWLRDRMGL
jgi:hypothetical protein